MVHCNDDQIAGRAIFCIHNHLVADIRPTRSAVGGPFTIGHCVRWELRSLHGCVSAKISGKPSNLALEGLRGFKIEVVPMVRLLSVVWILMPHVADLPWWQGLQSPCT